MTPTNLTLTFAKRPIRTIIDGTGAWFAAADVFASCRLPSDRLCLSHMAPEHLKLLEFSSDSGLARLTAVSPLGVATIAQEAAFPVNRILDAWIRKQAQALSETHGLPPMPYSLLADGSLPVRPPLNSRRDDDWVTLRLYYPRPTRCPANLEEPALFDQDPSLPKHDPVAVRAELGERYFRPHYASAFQAPPLPGAHRG